MLRGMAMQSLDLANRNQACHTPSTRTISYGPTHWLLDLSRWECLLSTDSVE
jgi:hypothetical protein